MILNTPSFAIALDSNLLTVELVAWLYAHGARIEDGDVTIIHFPVLTTNMLALPPNRYHIKFDNSPHYLVVYPNINLYETSIDFIEVG